jgi:hypothetical protein
MPLDINQATVLSNVEGQTTALTNAAGMTQFEYVGSSLVAVSDAAIVDGAGRAILSIDGLGTALMLPIVRRGSAS